MNVIDFLALIAVSLSISGLIIVVVRLLIK